MSITTEIYWYLILQITQLIVKFASFSLELKINYFIVEKVIIGYVCNFNVYFGIKACRVNLSLIKILAPFSVVKCRLI